MQIIPAERVKRMCRAVQNLGEILAAGLERARDAADLVRRLVDHIDIAPGAAPDEFELEACGRLGELTDLATRKQIGTTVQVVAGEGFEPPTLGL